MPDCRVRVMPVSGAQHASVHEMLHAAVHSMYIRDGWGPASTGRTGGASSFFSGSLSGQSPQNVEPPAFRSWRRRDTAGPVQTPPTLPVMPVRELRTGRKSALTATVPSVEVTVVEIEKID